MPVFPTLNLVRSYKNYGISVYGNTYDPIFQKGWLNSAPNILIQGNTCYLDYSHTYNTSDRSFLKKSFGVVPAGTTFNLGSVQYYDNKTETKKTLFGTCLYQSSLNDNKIIVGTIVSGLSGDTAYNFYNRENFLTSPQYTFTYSGNTSFNYILNSLPNVNQTNFEKMGFIGSNFGFEEYVEIIGGTGLNFGKLKVSALSALKDGEEVLYLTGTAQNQTLITTPTIVNMYIRGASDVDEIQKPKNLLGIYRIHDESNNLINCFENQNEYQTFLRKQSLGATLSGYWSQCQTCPDMAYGEDFIGDDYTSNLLFDNQVYLYIRTDTTTSFPDFVPVTSNFVLTQRNYSGDPQNASNLTFTITNGLKIDLSHASLQNWNFDLFVDPSYTQPLINSFVKSGVPGYNNAFVLIQKTEKTPSRLYGRFTGPSFLPVTIQI
jgi:hypothetical protein